jgi:catechol 2,3-dioxygenase-like lactoylglutathione lyase family enzyme
MTAIRHIGVTVNDLSKSLSFYMKYFGFSVKKKMEESGKVLDNFSSLKNVKVTTIKLIDSGGQLLELLYYKSHPNKKTKDNIKRKVCYVGCSHFAMTVKNIDKMYEKMNRDGIIFNYPPQISPDGKVKIAFCKDPDGTLLELVEEL